MMGLGDPNRVTNPERVIALDGVRGIAAIAVVIGHSYGAIESPPGIAGPAVQTFFVLSGYCLAASALRGDLLLSRAQYVLRRIFRIHPPFVFALIAAWLASIVPPAPTQMVATSFWIRRYMRVHLDLEELFGSLFFPGSAAGQMPVGWTLEVEMVFSLLLPVLLLIARRGHWLILIAGSLALMNQQERIYDYQVYALHFCLGIALFEEKQRIGRFSETAQWVMTFIVLAGIGYFTWIGVTFDQKADPLTALLRTLLKPQGCMALGAAFLTAGAVHVRTIRGFFSWGPVAFLGRISYSLYLVHFTVLLLCARQIERDRSDWTTAFFVMAVCAISIAIATVAYRLVELPSIRLGNRACAALARVAHGREELSRITAAKPRGAADESD